MTQTKQEQTKKSPRETLSEILIREPLLYLEPQRCEALLRDLCASYEREVNLLVSGLKQGVVVKLVESQRVVTPYHVTSARLTRQMVENLSLTEGGARWAVDSWAMALGIITEAEAKASEVALKREPRRSGVTGGSRGHDAAPESSASSRSRARVHPAPAPAPPPAPSPAPVTPAVKPKAWWLRALPLVALLLALTLGVVVLVNVVGGPSEPAAVVEPFTVEGIELRNETASGQRLSGGPDNFVGNGIRYMQFYVKLRNNLYGVRDTHGELKVKYIGPDGTVLATEKSPTGYTLSYRFDLPSSSQHAQFNHGWGSENESVFAAKGTWRVEFWSEGKKVGEKNFNVR